METVLPCTELEFSTFVGPIFPTLGLGNIGEVEDFWDEVQDWVAETFEDVLWTTTVGESLTSPIVSVGALIDQVETIANTAFPNLNCWAEPVVEDN